MLNLSSSSRYFKNSWSFIYSLTSLCCVVWQNTITIHEESVIMYWYSVYLQESVQNFVFCWSCISLQVLANDQLDALFRVFIYFISLHVSSITMFIIRRSNCINTSSGMISLCKWLLGMPIMTSIPSSYFHRLIIPDDVLIQFDLLIMSIVMLETCREMK